ncbi:uncharacterized protein LOC105843531 isoform X2 [Hydra vulgaris]|uniref:Uncharacterized protein LOC105843531 isoform X2 n=1 Tax=Hydra vulgaris TaxID=6087 RepID=A0ABM4BSM3_HYDVU
MFDNLVEFIINQNKINIEKSTSDTRVNYNEDNLVVKNLSKFCEIFDILTLKQYQKRIVNLSDCPEFGRRIGCHLTCTFDKKKKKDEQKFLHHNGIQTMELGVSKTSFQANEFIRSESDTQNEVSCKSALRYKSVRDTFRLDIFRNRKSSCHSNLFVYELPMFQQITKELCWNYDVGYSGYYPMQQHKLFVSELIKNSVLSHNLQKCSLSILPICFCGNYFAEPLFKVGSLILQSSNVGKEHLSNYQALLKHYVWEQFRPELALNIAMNYLENDSNFLEAYQFLTEYISSKPYRENPYFNILYGQLEYCMWKKTNNDTKKACTLIKYEWDDEECDSEPVESISSQFHRQRALLHLSLVEDRLGTWDLILPKYIELNKDNMVTILQKHLKNNPDNPVSYWYLAAVLKDIESEELWDVLKEFSAIDVTSDLIKELIIHYQENEKHEEVFKLVIERLDHNSCTNSLFDWEMLHWVVLHRKEVVCNYISSYPCWVSFHFSYLWNNKNQDILKPVLQLKILIANTLQIGNDWLSLYNNSQRKTSSSLEKFSDPCLVNVLLKYPEEEIFNDLDISSPEITDWSDSSVECLNSDKIKKYRKKAVKRQYNYKNIKSSVLTTNNSSSDRELFYKKSILCGSKDKEQTSFLLGEKAKYIEIRKNGRKRKFNLLYQPPSNEINQKSTNTCLSTELCYESGNPQLGSPQKNSNKKTLTNINIISKKLKFTSVDSVTPNKRIKLDSDGLITPNLKISTSNENMQTAQKNTSYRRESISSLSDSSDSSWNSDREINQIKMSVMKNIQNDTKKFTAKIIKSKKKSSSSESSWDSDKELQKIKTTRNKNTKRSINDSKKPTDKTIVTPLRSLSWENKVYKEFSNISSLDKGSKIKERDKEIP